MRTLGICVGATSLQYVELCVDGDLATVVSHGRIVHDGSPSEALLRLLKQIDRTAVDRVALTGRRSRLHVPLSSISEPEALEWALRRQYDPGPYPDLVLSAGGETRMLYRIGPHGTILSVAGGNKCASGTGEFFVQQIRRMGLSMEEAMALGREGTPQRIAGRCSVFCKSDCTHALNKGASKADIVAGLCLMMAEKVRELASGLSGERLLVVGGGAMNTVMVQFLQQSFACVDVLELSPVFEAYGAALWAGANPCRSLPVDPAKLCVRSSRSFGVHRPLAEFVGRVEFREGGRARPKSADRCVVGLDVGSTTTKAVVVRLSDSAVVAGTYQRTNGDPVAAARTCYAQLARELGGTDVLIEAIAVTGSGRQIAALHALSTIVVNEIRAHALAAAYYDPEVDTIFEVGGQDAKYTYLEAGVPCDYAMNEACSAGTGSFLEEAAGEMLGVSVDRIAPLAMQGTMPPDFRDECAAFIASDIKLAAQEGVGRNDILAGLVYSICLNYLNRVKGARPVGRRVFMQGGVCYNRAVPVAMAACMDGPIVVPPEPGLMGAFGAALEARSRLTDGRAAAGRIDLIELARRGVRTVGGFVCNGGVEKCDRRCRINRYEVNGRTYPFGGACDRYYNVRIGRSMNAAGLDFVARREMLLFESGCSVPRRENGKTVGINRAFLTHSLYPLFATFFSEVGFRIVLSPEIRSEDMAHAGAAFCLPALVSHAAFASLLRSKPDYIFLPHITQLPVPAVTTHSRLCVFAQGEPYYVRATFREEIESSTCAVVSPVIGLEKGYEQGEEVMIETAMRMGIARADSQRAWAAACERQREFERDLRRLGEEALARVADHPERLGIVVFGRSYNALASEINMGVPHKVASRGHVVIPLDMLPADRYPVEATMFWASGQRILKAAQYVKEHDALFGIYITNFSCGPDSFLLSYFRDTMAGKPSLTLELDQHTANAGIDTRIEAALEIMQSWRRRGVRHVQVMSGYTPARVESDGRSVVDSAGRRRSITDNDVEVLLPPMGRYSAPALAAVMRGMGINARVLPDADRDTLLAARRYATCKECLPYHVTAGSFLRYLDQPRPDSLLSLLFMPTGGGPCRLGQYREALRRTIERRRDRNVAVLSVTDENGYAGLGVRALLRAWQAIVCADVFEDIRNMLCVTAADPIPALRELDAAWQECLRQFEGRLSLRLTTLLSLVSARMARIPLRRNPADVPAVAVVGEYYVRKENFSRRTLVDYLQAQGLMVRVAPAMEYILYSNYNASRGLQERQSPMGPVAARVRGTVQEWWERRIKVLLARSGLYRCEMTDVARTIAGVRHLVDERFRGETVLTVGSALREIVEHVCGVVAIGPFGCMPSRISEAILRVEMTPKGKARMPGWAERAAVLATLGELPFLSIETDGNPFPQSVEASLEAFVLQARRLHARLKPLSVHRRRSVRLAVEAAATE